jgi:hypothetical protein
VLNGRPLRSYHDAASEVKIADLSEQHEFTPGFRGMRVAQSWIFSVVICKSLFVLFLLIIAWFILQFIVSDYQTCLKSLSGFLFSIFLSRRDAGNNKKRGVTIYLSIRS